MAYNVSFARHEPTSPTAPGALLPHAFRRTRSLPRGGVVQEKITSARGVRGRDLEALRPGQAKPGQDHAARSAAPAGSLAHRSRAPGTVNRRLALVSHLYTVARKEWGYPWLANPVQLVTRPAVDDARDRRLFTRIRLNGLSEVECPRSELDWIIRATRSDTLPTVLVLAKETAMRRSEIVMLRREQIDLTHGVVTLVDTKNGDTRYVPLSPFARDALRKWLAGRPMRGRIFDITAGAITRAFARARMRAQRQYEDLCRKHGRRPVRAYFTDLRLHDLRHEATTVLSDVYPAHALAKVTGHRDTRMLMRYYNPRGRDLAQQLMRSKLGRWQAEQLRMAA